MSDPSPTPDLDPGVGFQGGRSRLPSASNLWVQSSLNQKQRLQQLFFPEGVRFDGKRLVGTGLTLPVFNYLAPAGDSEVRMVDQTGIESVTL